ncbi:MAG: nucleoside deaminase [Burkholderiales bacterium]|nr:nucleoside deaminase [Burkholderiales bacterium]
MSEVLSRFAQLSLKKGLPLTSLKKSPEEVSTVVNTFLSCCTDPKHPSENEAQEFLKRPGSWLSISEKELLGLAKETPFEIAKQFLIEDVERIVADQGSAIRQEKRRRALLLEKKAAERKIDGQKDKLFMAEAIEQAKLALMHDEVPIGAVLVNEKGEILSKSFNCVESSNDPCGHAEIRVLREAAQKLGTWRLNKCVLYVTVEPCAMCTGALINAKISRLVFGVSEPKTGAVVTNVDLLSRIPGANKISITKGVLADESSQLIKRFFANKRKNSTSREE